MPEIREAFESDVDNIAKVHHECWLEHYHFLPDAVQKARPYEYRQWQWQRYFEGRGPEGGMLFSVISDHGLLIGFGFACANSDPAIAAKGELHAAYISPGHRGGVAGGMLLLAMVDHLEECGLWPACIWAWRENKIRLNYSLLGFKVVVRRCRTINGVDVPEVGYISPDAAVIRRRVEAGLKIRSARDAWQKNPPHSQISHHPHLFVDRRKYLQ